MSNQSDAYKKILVALDLSKMDEILLRYTKIIANQIKPSTLYIMHVISDKNIPESILDRFPDLQEGNDESVVEEINNKVSPILADTSPKPEVIIQKGSPIEKLLHFSSTKSIDLILMGRKASLVGSGLVSSHIARECPTSILFVTENYADQVSKVMVPCDFSSHSLKAVRSAEGILAGNGTINLLHIYQVPVGYTKVGKTFEEFGAIMEENAIKDSKLFKKQYALSDYQCDFQLQRDDEVSTMIFDHAKKEDAHLIVMGSRGRTKTSALLMGSVAEKLVFEDSDIPVLIVKSKGENMGFFKTLLKI